MNEPKKLVNAYESDYNTLTLIAKKEGLCYPEGHTSAGKMIAAKVIQHVVKYYCDSKKGNASMDQALNEGSGVYKP